MKKTDSDKDDLNLWAPKIPRILAHAIAPQPIATPKLWQELIPPHHGKLLEFSLMSLTQTLADIDSEMSTYD